MNKSEGRGVILAAAQRSFALQGYEGTSIRDIAREADLSLSALYYHFPSKQDALFELVTTAFDDFLELGQEAVKAGGDDPRSQLDSLVRFTVHFRVVNAEQSRVLLLEDRSLNEQQHAVVRAKQVEANDLFHLVVQRGCETGMFATPWPYDSVRAIISMCNAISIWYRPAGPLMLADLQDEYVHFAFRVVEGEPIEPVPVES